MTRVPANAMSRGTTTRRSKGSPVKAGETAAKKSEAHERPPAETADLAQPPAHKWPSAEGTTSTESPRAQKLPPYQAVEE